MNHKHLFNSLLLALALTLSAFAQGQRKVVPPQPAPRFPVANITWQTKPPVKPVAPITWSVKTNQVLPMNPLRRLPQTFVPQNNFEKQYTSGADTHPVQYHRDSNGKTIYATGAHGPTTYTNPLLVLPQTGRRK